jgi:hypothetical protein
MSGARTTRFHLRDLLLAPVFVALFAGGFLLYVSITEHSMKGLASVPIAMALFIWIIVVTVVAAATIRNCMVGATVLVFFYFIFALRDLLQTSAEVTDILKTCTVAFVVHAIFYFLTTTMIRRAN